MWEEAPRRLPFVHCPGSSGTYLLSLLSCGRRSCRIAMPGVSAAVTGHGPRHWKLRVPTFTARWASHPNCLVASSKCWRLLKTRRLSGWWSGVANALGASTLRREQKGQEDKVKSCGLADGRIAKKPSLAAAISGQNMKNWWQHMTSAPKLRSKSRHGMTWHFNPLLDEVPDFTTSTARSTSWPDSTCRQKV